MREGVPLRKLGDICDIIGGGTPSKKRKDYYNGDVPWATVRDMNYDELSDTDYRITQLGLENSSTNVIPKDNVVIATRVGLGKVCKLNQDTAINQDLKGIIPKNSNLLTDYLFLWFKSISDKIIEAGTGATVQGVKIPFVKNLHIPIPPLPEQKRIVAILDEAFEAIDRARANIERNIKNAEELFQSKLNEIFSEIAGGRKNLKEVCEIIGGGTPSKKKEEYYGGDIPWATVRDMNYDELETTDHKITKLGLENSSSNVIPEGNVVIATRVGLGKICLLKQDTAINQDLKGILPKIDNLKPEYLFVWFKSIADQIVAAGTGATVQGVKLPFVRSLKIPLISIAEQNKIIENYNKSRNSISLLLESYEKKLEAIEELKKSILQKAFSGTLVGASGLAGLEDGQDGLDDAVNKVAESESG